MKKDKILFKDFQPEEYCIEIKPSDNKKTYIGSVKIKAKKTGRPSRRITLHQKNIKILSAKLESLGKKPTSYVVERVNHLSTFEQVRIHTKEMIYPGFYVLELTYSGNMPNKPDQQNLNRQSVPSIDEIEAWNEAEIKFI